MIEDGGTKYLFIVRTMKMLSLTIITRFIHFTLPLWDDMNNRRCFEKHNH